MNDPVKLAAGLLAWFVAAPALAAQDTTIAEGTSSQAAPQIPAPTSDDAQSLAKKLSNPVASLISVPFQANLDFGIGLDDDGNKATLNIQPVVPISISASANIILRTIVPITYQTGIRGSGESDFGLGDVVQSFFYSPKEPTSGGIIWGAGPVFLYPTATSKYTGGDKWGAGPTIVVLKQKGQLTVGALANHIWSIAGPANRPDISVTFMQPFVSYTTRRATTYSLNTESTYDWLSKQWSVPVNIQVSQLLRVGKQPISLGLGGRYYVVRPDFGPDWGVRFITTFLFPKK